jgi:hypothetical protein
LPDFSFTNLGTNTSPAEINQNPGFSTAPNRAPAPIMTDADICVMQIDSESEAEDDDAESSGAEFDSDVSLSGTLPEAGPFKGMDAVSLILEQTREHLVDAIMRQFWTTVNRKLLGNIRMHTGSSSTSSASTSEVFTSSTRPSNVSSGKRIRKDEGQEFPEEDDDGSAKKPKRL